MADYLPHTSTDLEEMLRFLGLDSLDHLFAHVPAALQLAAGLAIDDGQSEPDVAEVFKEYTEANRATTAKLTCFAGAGSYDHAIPPVVKTLSSRSEFVTAYTPYQPEVAQGVLQAIFEYQTMIARLSGLPIANASLYDGATALVEAVNMAVGATGKDRVLMSAGVHPHWRNVVATFAAGTGHTIEIVPLRDGHTVWPDELASDVGAVVSAYPNYLGVLEDLPHAKQHAARAEALFIVAGDPVAAAVLNTAGSLGADIFVGEGQPFGTALAFGGPYLGLFACTEELIRRLPGRLVGETVDTTGRRSFVTTLRAREQDIRREKATSNVCTNQTLMAVTAAVQLGYLGTQGLREVATRCAQGAHYAFSQLSELPSVTAATTGSFFREFALRTATRADVVLERLVDEGFLGGVSVNALTGDTDASVHQPDHVVLVTVTEQRTKREIDAFVAAFEKAVK